MLTASHHAASLPSLCKLAMMGAAERNSELVADLTAKRPRLCEPKVMRIRWRASRRDRATRQQTVDVSYLAALESVSELMLGRACG